MARRQVRLDGGARVRQLRVRRAEKADGFAADGIAGVGVLDSDDFTSLKQGFWVVFAGEYDSQSEAAEALDGIDAKDAYIRRVEPV